MSKYLSITGGLFALALSASAASASLQVSEVGVNSFSTFPATGGNGSIVTQDPTHAVLEKNFIALGDVPIILHADPSIGVDTLHIDERVTNSTGVAWTDFHLVFGTIDANPLLQVDFLNVTNPTGEFSTITPGLNTLSLVGNVPSGGTFSLSFDLQATSIKDSFDLFGIHETPSVPEPSSLTLFAGLVCGALPFVARRRKARS